MDNWEIMYFISPEGDFYKVERFGVFCDTFNLEPLEMCKLWKEEIEVYKEWRKADMETMTHILVMRAYRDEQLEKQVEEMYSEKIDLEGFDDFEYVMQDIAEQDERAMSLINFLVESLMKLPKPLLLEVLDRLPQEIIEEI